MAGVYKRGTDKARGKVGKWTAWWLDEAGKRQTRSAFTDRAKSLALAQEKEAHCRRVREGLVDPAEASRLREMARPIGEHVADYADDIVARGATAKHGQDARRSLAEVFNAAGVATVAELDPVKLSGVLSAMRHGGLSARTCNKRLGFIKAFATWLYEVGRAREPLRGLGSIDGFNVAEARVRQRRALSLAEVEQLLTATEAAGPVVVARGPRDRSPVPVSLTGPQRAAVYRLALGTGFRADEIRTLTVGRFKLDGPTPSVTVLACYSKNGKEAEQPIGPGLATRLRPFVEGRRPDERAFILPAAAGAMLARDLRAAGIDPTDTGSGLVDFHSLRATFISRLVDSGVSVKVTQTLARHSTPTLTIGVYAKAQTDDIRAAVADLGVGGTGLDDALGRLRELTTGPDCSPPIGLDVVTRAASVLHAVAGHRLPMPTLATTDDGGIALAWSRGGRFFRLTLQVGGVADGYLGGWKEQAAAERISLALPCPQILAVLIGAVVGQP